VTTSALVIGSAQIVTLCRRRPTRGRGGCCAGSTRRGGGGDAWICSRSFWEIFSASA